MIFLHLYRSTVAQRSLSSRMIYDKTIYSSYKEKILQKDLKWQKILTYISRYNVKFS